MFENRIRELRIDKRLSQKQLAAAAQISPAQLNRIEAGIQPARLDIAGRICVVLDEALENVFPGTRETLSRLRREGKGFEDLVRGQVYVAPMEQAGIDMDPEIWIAKLYLRGHGNRQFTISGIERKRLWKVLQHEDPDDFVVFDADTARIALNRRHLLAWHFLFEAPIGIGEDAEQEKHSASVWLADGSAPLQFGVEPDVAEYGPEENDGPQTQLQYLLSMLETAGGEKEAIVSLRTKMASTFSSAPPI